MLAFGEELSGKGEGEGNHSSWPPSPSISSSATAAPSCSNCLSRRFLPNEEALSRQPLAFCRQEELTGTRVISFDLSLSIQLPQKCNSWGKVLHLIFIIGNYIDLFSYLGLGQ